MAGASCAVESVRKSSRGKVRRFTWYSFGGEIDECYTHKERTRGRKAAENKMRLKTATSEWKTTTSEWKTTKTRRAGRLTPQSSNPNLRSKLLPLSAQRSTFNDRILMTLIRFELPEDIANIARAQGCDISASSSLQIRRHKAVYLGITLSWKYRNTMKLSLAVHAAAIPSLVCLAAEGCF